MLFAAGTDGHAFGIWALLTKQVTSGQIEGMGIGEANNAFELEVNFIILQRCATRRLQVKDIFFYIMYLETF